MFSFIQLLRMFVPSIFIFTPLLGLLTQSASHAPCQANTDSKISLSPTRKSGKHG